MWHRRAALWPRLLADGAAEAPQKEVTTGARFQNSMPGGCRWSSLCCELSRRQQADWRPGAMLLHHPPCGPAGRSRRWSALLRSGCCDDTWLWSLGQQCCVL